jgi:hypothetical protein
MNIAILSAGPVLGIISTGLLHWWTLNRYGV